MKLITRGTTSFYVDGAYSEKWFQQSVSSYGWEPETFNIIDKYGNINKSYIDVGAWIGPTVLYANNKYKHCYAFEPDPVAYDQLMQNIKVNNFDITVVKMALDNNTGTTLFGGNGAFGNSMSTLLVRKEDDMNDGTKRQNKNAETLNIETITIEDFINKYDVCCDNIGLIKMDIEGSEYYVVPAMKSFLEKYKIPFYISLHWCFLKEEHVMEIIDILFDIYGDNCYLNDIKKIPKEEIFNHKLTTLVFRI